MRIDLERRNGSDDGEPARIDGSRRGVGKACSECSSQRFHADDTFPRRCPGCGRTIALRALAVTRADRGGLDAPGMRRNEAS